MHGDARSRLYLIPYSVTLFRRMYGTSIDTSLFVDEQAVNEHQPRVNLMLKDIVSAVWLLPICFILDLWFLQNFEAPKESRIIIDGSFIACQFEWVFSRD